MQLNEAIELIRHPFFSTGKQLWAELGCGEGLFTLALSNLLLPGSKIIAVDKDIRNFKLVALTNSIIIEKIEADFILDDPGLKNLDGLLMANAFHFVKDKASFLKKMTTCFAGAGNFLMVEYDTDTANPWVPYPISFISLKNIFSIAGYSRVDKLNELPSKYRHANMYAAFVTK